MRYLINSLQKFECLIFGLCMTICLCFSNFLAARPGLNASEVYNLFFAYICNQTITLYFLTFCLVYYFYKKYLLGDFSLIAIPRSKQWFIIVFSVVMSLFFCLGKSYDLIGNWDMIFGRNLFFSAVIVISFFFSVSLFLSIFYKCILKQ